jgi:FAD/FMN-containing dehydrogenase
MVPDHAIRAFAAGFHGRLIQPADDAYPEARRVWNGLIDRRPALIAQCADPADVVRAVRLAAQHELLLAIRGGGHNVAGFGTCDDGLVIDLSPMHGVEVDPAAGVARVQGGATWGQVDAATQAHGLATTGGLVSTTGVAGLTLGGGIGWLMRRHGLALDNLLAVDLVTADGRELRASAEENPDLFWALRGGGGNFGIVTRFTFRLHPVGPMIYGGVTLFPLARAREVLGFYRDWTPGLPDELTTMVVFLTAPPAPFIPPELRGTPMVALALCYVGPLEKGPAAVATLRALAPAVDVVGPMPYLALQGMFDAGAPKGLLAYWKSEYLSALGAEAIESLAAHAEQMIPPFTQLHLHQLGGAVARVAPESTALGFREAPFVVNAVAGWTDPAQTAAQIAWSRSVGEALRPFAAGPQYLNFMGDDDSPRIRRAYGEAHYRRLAAVKASFDPTNLFRLNQNIPPAAGGGTGGVGG